MGHPPLLEDTRKSFPKGRKAEIEEKEAVGLLIECPCANPIASEIILRKHIFLSVIFLHRKRTIWRWGWGRGD